MQIAIVGTIIGIVLFLCLYLGFKQGIRLGMNTVKGTVPEPIKSPVSSFKDYVQTKEEIKKQREADEAFMNLLTYDGTPQKGVNDEE